ncbi:MAG: 5'-nucleotidase C-terminal domain-containing protein [Bacteroidales bacterium]|nr:5'-nucleotidase C-terminal domain-containing protein [Bacteroidales bacterium]
MKKLSLIFLSAALLLSCAERTSEKNFTYSWTTIPMDGSRTGVTNPYLGTEAKALGVIAEDGTYVAPSKTTFDPFSIVTATAKILIDAQPLFANQKEIIATCPTGIARKGPKGELGYWCADAMQKGAEAIFNTKIDVVFLNLGGIRVDMPKGNVLREDILSMIPFRNQIIIYKMTGQTLLDEFNRIMSTRFQPVGGATLIMEGEKVVDAIIDGKSIDKEHEYTVLGNSFLDNGGDGFNLGSICSSKVVYDQYILFDLIERYVLDCTAAGIPLSVNMNNRIIRR